MLLRPGQIRDKTGAKIRTVKVCLFGKSFLVYCALSCTVPMKELCCTVLSIVLSSKVLLCSPGTGHSSSLCYLLDISLGTVLLIVLHSHL